MDLFNSLQEIAGDDSPRESVLSSDEIEALIINLAKSRGEKGFTEEECFAWIKWAEAQRIGSSLVDLTIRGFVEVDWIGNEPVFSASKEGKKIIEEMKGISNGLN